MLLNKNNSSQKGSAVLGIIIGVFIIMVAVLIAIAALGYIKGKFDGPCKWLRAVDSMLSSNFSDNVVCGTAGIDETSGTGGPSSCSGSAVDVIKLTGQLKNDEGLRLYPYKDSNKNCTIGYGHNLQGGNNDNFTSVVTNKTPQDFINACCPDSSKECSTPHPVITEDQATAILQKDIAPAEDNVKKIITTYNSLPGDVKQILLEMYFQLGGNLDGYTKMKAALEASPPDYTKAAQEMIDSKTYDDLHCGNKTDDIANIATLDSTGRCRTVRQAIRMRDIQCVIATIPPLPNPPGINTCSLEKNCVPKGTYKGDGRDWPVCQAVSDALNLDPIDPKVVKLDASPKYITLIIEQALEQASNSCGQCFTVTSAYRSCEQQNELFNSHQTPTQGGGSNHNGGQGVDIVGTGDNLCNSEQCSAKLVNFLASYGIVHYNDCNVLSGDYYVPPSTSTYHDCLHFSPNGR